ncbi:hypothetical protein N7447_002904 [Penicillium robsamsonii]|uniref:uncharacterized protein n=1 Tax=Penicillium robsamsonii TaxID=1792511 RepID=UPI0025492EE3|nr:uncharacterized protein N7447_002904 [Penicillium robsamsonii]KAJ5836878.1 hypothetical protein N7447_002904 [Penicillium robsamsonii]
MGSSQHQYQQAAPPEYGQQNPMMHQNPGNPGQSYSQGNEWNYSLFDCFSPGDVCLIGCCFPYVTFGKTSARMKDPSLRNFSIFNGECLLWGCLSLGWLNWTVQTARRSELRRRFGIEGSCCGDCMAVFFCSQCTVIQEEKEATMRLRDEQNGYNLTQQMVYP